MRHVARSVAGCVLAATVAACSSTPIISDEPQPTDTPAPTIVATPIPTRTPSATAIARTYELTIPDGWLAVEITPDGLRRAAAGLEAAWPAVSQALETAAAGGPSPFQSNQTLLAYDLRPDDLARYPTAFNVAEVGGQIECRSLDLESSFTASGIQDVRTDAFDVDTGRAVRVAGRITGGPTDLLGETFVVEVGGRTYEPYFETLWDQRAAFEPIFEEVARSLRVTVPAPPPASGGLPSPLPHHDPQLEATLPGAVLGRPLCRWSATATRALEFLPDEGPYIHGLLAALDVDATAVSVAVAGRVSDSDPASTVTAWHLRGADVAAKLAAQFADWQGEMQLVGEKTVYVVQGERGIDYFYVHGPVLYWIRTYDPAWYFGAIGQLP